ncbi:MAG: hypothetical protein R3F20_01015 [Planctomycetota bacterium]
MTRFLLLGVALILVACGDDPAPDSGSGGKSSAASERPADWRDLVLRVHRVSEGDAATLVLDLVPGPGTSARLVRARLLGADGGTGFESRRGAAEAAAAGGTWTLEVPDGGAGRGPRRLVLEDDRDRSFEIPFEAP